MRPYIPMHWIKRPCLCKFLMRVLGGSPRVSRGALETAVWGLRWGARLLRRPDDGEVGGGRKTSASKAVRLPNMIRPSILSTSGEMPAWMVGLLDTLFQSQNIYLIDLYCFRKVLPEVKNYLHTMLTYQSTSNNSLATLLNTSYGLLAPCLSTSVCL